jgi:putative oxidoreductase
MTSLAFLILRLTVGALIAGHGAQKLFGMFEGPGPEGTSRMMDRLGVHPARRWAYAAGASELVGGALSALGLLNPLGPIAALGSMGVATLRAHRGKPIWVTKGGPELPVTNIAVLVALILAGPGRLSLDALFSVKIPWWFSFLALAGMGAGVAVAITPVAPVLPAPRRAAAPSSQREEARTTAVDVEEPAT